MGKKLGFVDRERENWQPKDVVVVVHFIFRSHRWTRMTERAISKVVSAILGEPNGVQVGKFVGLQTTKESAPMNLVECSQSMRKVLRTCGCHVKLNFF